MANAFDTPASGTPFRMAIMGNFRGVREPSASRHPVAVDKDNLESVLAKMNVRLHLPNISGSPIELSFREIEDFHPDQLYQRLEIFDTLRDVRKRIGNPDTFSAAADQVRAMLGEEEATAPDPGESEPNTAPPKDIDPEDLLNMMMAASDESPAPTPRHTSSVPDRSDFKQFLKKITEGHTVPNVAAEQQHLTDLVDAAIQGLMGDILHHPDFQHLEANWRAVKLLVQRLETDHAIKLYLIDITREELAQDLAGGVMESHLYQQFVEQSVNTPGAEPWSLLIGAYSFDKNTADAELLTRISQLASFAGAPFLAAAHSRVFGCPQLTDLADPREWQPDTNEEDETAWTTLRSQPESACLGLLAPRFLLRLPYGKGKSETERFAYEEMPTVRHKNFLWGNPAFLAAYCLGQTFMRQGWGMHPGALLQIDNLPLAIYEEDGENHAKPCGEYLLSDRVFEVILDAGVMPVMSVKDRNIVKLGRIQALMDPLTQLVGRWQ